MRCRAVAGSSRRWIHGAPPSRSFPPPADWRSGVSPMPLRQVVADADTGARRRPRRYRPSEGPGEQTMNPDANLLQRFGESAQAFEKTYVDDDWTRLEPYFAPDAVYRVGGSTSWD